MGYRSWAERRHIIRSVIAADVIETSLPQKAQELLGSHNLSDSEIRFFRAQANRAVTALAMKTSTFKSYYLLRKTWPFLPFVIFALAIVCACLAASIYLCINWKVGYPPLLAATATVAVATVGWAVAGWIAHRNATVQHTINVLSARFSQATFTDHTHRFHRQFGYDSRPKVDLEVITKLKNSPKDDERKTYQSIVYILNYFEFLATGAISGDLDEEIVRRTLKETVSYYFDKCEPLITSLSKSTPAPYSYFTRLRDAYREP